MLEDAFVWLAIVCVIMAGLLGLIVSINAMIDGEKEPEQWKPVCDKAGCGQPITHDKTTWLENKQGLSVSYWCPVHAPEGSKALEFEEDLDIVLAVIAEMILESRCTSPILDEARSICDHYGVKLLAPEFIGYVRASVYWANKRD